MNLKSKSLLISEMVLDQTSTTPAAVNREWRTARIAVASLFLLNGALFASWVSRIPAVQMARGLSHGTLGLALLAIALGAVVAMPLSGVLSARHGSERVSKISALLYCALTPLIIVVPNLWMFIVILFLFGAFHGALDVAMNAQAVVVEKLYRQPIMSSFHALWSTGGLVGAATGGLIAAQGITPLPHLGFAALLTAIGVMVIIPRLLQGEKHPAPPEREARKFSLPPRSLLVLGVVALCVMAGEGAMADWSAVYLRSHLQTSEAVAAIGYAAFSICMATGRFLGDGLTARLGTVTLVRFSGLIAATGLSMTLLCSRPAVALIGFGLVGVGFATVVPSVFTAAGRVPGISPGVALASVSSLGYLGFLASPPVIGLVAEVIGLRGALGLIIATSLTVALLAPMLRQANAKK